MNTVQSTISVHPILTLLYASNANTVKLR